VHRLLLEGEGLISFDGPRGWIVATLIAVVVIVAFGIPMYEKIREAIGKAAEPKITEHNECADAHPDLRQAVALLNQAIKNIQEQITGMETHRRESFQAIQEQLRIAIDLLPKE
jgi:hypothetical protein